jgi:hypothetical protein
MLAENKRHGYTENVKVICVYNLPIYYKITGSNAYDAG